MLSIKRNLVYNFLLSASMVLFPLVSIPYISRVLHPDGIGKVSFIDSFTYFFIGIAEFGIAVYGTREVARQRDDPERLGLLVSELMTLHVITSAIACLLYFISVFFMWSRIDDIRLLFFSVSFLIVNSFACEWYFWGMEKFRFITVRALLTRALGLVSIFILVNEPSDYYIYYAIIVLSAIANFIWNLIIIGKEVSFRFIGLNWKKHLRNLSINYLVSLVYGITLTLDNVLLRITSSAASVGLYSFSMKIVRLSSLLLTDSLLVFFPRAVQAVKNARREDFQHLLLRNVQMIIIISVPVCGGIFFLSREIVSGFLGPAFEPAADNLKILALFPFLKAYNLYLGNQVLVSRNNEGRYLRNLSISSLFYVPCILILSDYYHDAGAAVAIVLYEFLLLLLNAYYVRRNDPDLKIFDWKSFLHAALAILLFIPVIYFARKWYGSELIVLMISIPVCAGIYFAVLGVFLKNEFVLTLTNAGLRLIRRLTADQYQGK